MNQVALFHDSIYDAYSADIAASGGFKAVGSKLWPTLSPDDAAKKLRKCVDKDDAQKLSEEERMRVKELARDAGSFAVVTYEGQHLGYRVEWLSPQDEADELRREVRDYLKAVNQRLERIERAEQRATIMQFVKETR